MKRFLFVAVAAAVVTTTHLGAMIPEQVKIDIRPAGRHRERPADACACSRAFRSRRRRSARTAGRRRSRPPSGTACARPTPSARRAPQVRPAAVAAAGEGRHLALQQRHRALAAATPPAPAAPPREPARSEDCLYLNVWTSAKNANDRRPVMVWIYGGGFTGGSGGLAVVRRREPRREGSGHRHHQLSSRLARLLRASGAGEGIGPQRLRQLRDDGRDRRAAVGQAEHQRVRRRSEQRDHRRRIGGRDHGRRARRLTAGEGPVQPRDRPERRLDGADDGPHDAGRKRRRPTAPRRWKRSASRRSRSCARSRSNELTGLSGGRAGRRRLPHSRGPLADVPERQAERR